MSPPRLDPSEEKRRHAVVQRLDLDAVRDDAALQLVAETVAEICDVPFAHVSFTETDHQTVVSEAGDMEIERRPREQTFCAYPVVEREILVVEDASRDKRFADNSLVTDGPEISFYVGLPLILDEVPIGTISAMAHEPQSLQRDQRVELFGLVNAVECHLEIVHAYGPNSPQHEMAVKLTAARVRAARQRIGADDRELQNSLGEVETRIKNGLELLREPDRHEQVEPSGIGFNATEVEEAST